MRGERSSRTTSASRATASTASRGAAASRRRSPLASFRQVTNGGWDPYEYNYAEPSIVIGNNAVNAVGYAMGVQHDGAESAVMACIGDGAMSQGDIAEAFVWASVFQAPIVFLLQNNHWAISEPTERQSRIPLYHRADGFGFPGVRVDGNDVFAMLAVTRAALATGARGLRADADRGVHLPDGRAHDVGRPDALPRRRRGRGVAAARPDRAAARATSSRRARPTRRGPRRSTRRPRPLARELREAVVSMRGPSPVSIFDHVYAEPHPLVDEERAQMVALLGAEDAGSLK